MTVSQLYFKASMIEIKGDYQTAFLLRLKAKRIENKRNKVK